MCDLVCIPVKRTASGMHRFDIFGPRCVVKHSELMSSAVTCAWAQSHYRKITFVSPDAYHASERLALFRIYILLCFKSGFIIHFITFSKTGVVNVMLLGYVC